MVNSTSDTASPASSTVPAVPRVVILIISWNRVDELTTCLQSFACVNYSNYEVVIVDNASEDATVQTAREQFPWATLIANGENLGYVGGSNIGFRYALEHAADYALLLNQDTKMTPSLLPGLIDVMQGDPRIAIAGAKNVLMERPQYTWGKYGVLTWGPLLVQTAGAGQPDCSEASPRDVDWVIGNGCMFRRAALEHVGLFDEEFFHLEEDVDWSTRAKRAGYRVVYVDSAVILHKGSSSSDSAQPVVFSYAYFLGRNAILFARKHATPVQWAKLLTLMTLGLGLRIVWYVFHAMQTAVRDQRPFVTGLVDGFSGRLRRDHITVRRSSTAGAPANRLLQRFLRWVGA